MNELEKMLSGKPYDASADGLPQKRAEAHRLCSLYNATYETEEEKRADILGKLLRHAHPSAYIQGPFYCDYGDYLTIGKNFYANFNFTVLDCCPVTIGDDVFIGPNVSLLTPVHPLRWQQRNIRRRGCRRSIQPAACRRMHIRLQYRNKIRRCHVRDIR